MLADCTWLTSCSGNKKLQSEGWMSDPSGGNKLGAFKQGHQLSICIYKTLGLVGNNTMTWLLQHLILQKSAL